MGSKFKLILEFLGQDILLISNRRHEKGVTRLEEQTRMEPHKPSPGRITFGHPNDKRLRLQTLLL